MLTFAFISFFLVILAKKVHNGHINFIMHTSGKVFNYLVNQSICYERNVGELDYIIF